MPQTDIDGAVASDLQNVLEDFKVVTEVTDAAQGSEDYKWMMSDWPEHLGYYKNIPELKTAINTKVLWTIGAGFEANEETKLLLMRMKGSGKSTFNSIISNQQRVSILAGDSFAEIIRDENGVLANLKPLDPSSMQIISTGKGIIKGYAQINKIRETIRPFEPDEIFHLSRDRIADEIHGTSVIPAVKWIIDARNEAMNDWRKVLHRNLRPFIIWHLDTDDQTEIAAFKTKTDKASADNENIYIPKGTVVPEIVTPLQNNATNPLTWVQQLNDYFFQVVNMPQIIVGNAKAFTDASGKIVYLAYEQGVKGDQLYIEEQVLNQLNVEIKLTFPASLQNELISDQPMELEEEEQEPAAQPNDTTEEIEGKE